MLRDKDGKSTRQAGMMKGPFKSGVEEIVDMRKDKGMVISVFYYAVIQGSRIAERDRTLIELTNREELFLRDSIQGMIKPPVNFQ